MSNIKKYEYLSSIVKRGLKRDGVTLCLDSVDHYGIDRRELVRNFLEENMELLNMLFLKYMQEPLKQAKAEAEKEAKEFLGLSNSKE